MLFFISLHAIAGVTYITPNIDGGAFCKSAFHSDSVKNNEDAARFCFNHNEDSADTIKNALNKIDKGKVYSGDFALGYTLTLPLFRYYQKNSNGEWVINEKFLRHDLNVISEINRPVNIYLSLNHFTDSNVEMSKELAKDSRNIMWNANGPMKISDYFGYPVIPWNISDVTSPIFKYRESVMISALKQISNIVNKYPGRIVGVSLLGEVHQMNNDILAGPSYSVDMNEISDYSPSSKKGFTEYLTERFKNISELNDFAGSSFSSFESVEPPSKNIRKDVLSSFFQHNDVYSSGILNLYGWLTEKRNCDFKLNVYIDGKYSGDAEYGLNRTDVVEAIGSKNPNVGFRYSIDFRKMDYGIHKIWLIEKCGNDESLLDQRLFTYVDRKQSKSNVIFDSDSTIKLHNENTKISVDGPVNSQDVFYNPISELWNDYRSKTVFDYISHFAIIASKYIPKQLIFSHQITTEINGSWNSEITSELLSKKQNRYYSQGTTLYGGAAFSDEFFKMAARNKWKRYAINEINPMSDLSVSGYINMMKRHHESGAVFISPYFISVISDVLPSTGLNMFELKPGNTKVHSDQFYQALVDIMDSH